ncbi:MAG: class I SAM-dependent methyltransferase [Flavobacterium sp.]|nr:class I SAM-dependent methyltransferase [Flavobacterium sp.]
MSQNIPIEKVKKYWDERPCNIRHSQSKIGTRQYFNEVERRKYFVEPHIPRFAEFEKWRGKKVLEIGCGIGTDTINFARSGAQVTATDISEKSLDLMRQRARVFGLEDKIKFYCGNAEKLSEFVPVEPYDLIYSFGVIHHTPNPGRVIEEIRKYVYSGSVIKIMVYHRYSWKVLWILLTYGKGAFWKLDELIAQNSEAQGGSPVTYTFSIKDIRNLLKEFKIINISIEHIFPYKISDYVHYQYNKVWYFRFLPKSIFRWLEKHFGWHLCVTAIVP